MHKHVGTQSHLHKHYYINAKMECFADEIRYIIYKADHYGLLIAIFPVVCYLHVSSVPSSVPTTAPVFS